MRPRTHARGFTLIELLIVVAIIGVLATLLLSAIFGAKSKANIGVAKSQIRAIQAALQMYEGDHGKFPRKTVRPTGTTKPAAGHECWNDDAGALYAALRNKPTRELGGGQNSPYLDWKSEQVGILEDNVAAGSMGNATNNGITPLTPDQCTKLGASNFQQGYPVAGTKVLVLLDPWGNPFHYREWSSIRNVVKDDMIGGNPYTRAVVGPPPMSGQAPLPGPVPDTIHNPEQYDIWSNGPNGVNEYGAPGSDDVTSWSQ